MPTIYYVQSKLQQAFMDEADVIRKTVANVMAIILVRGGLNIWPDLLQFLTNNLPQQGQIPTLNKYQLSIVEASIHTISIIFEDCSDLFREEPYASRLDAIVTKIFPLLASFQETFGGDTDL